MALCPTASSGYDPVPWEQSSSHQRTAPLHGWRLSVSGGTRVFRKTIGSALCTNIGLNGMQQTNSGCALNAFRTSHHLSKEDAERELSEFLCVSPKPIEF
jgi:hypothetical protein